MNVNPPSLLRAFVALAAFVLYAGTASATMQGISITLTPHVSETYVGDQIVYTVTLRNDSASAVSGLRLRNYSRASEINFFLASDGGEIHPGRITWPTFALQPGQTKTVKMRSQILSAPRSGMIQTVVSVEGGVLTQPIYAYTTVYLPRVMPVTGADLQSHH